MPPRPERQGGTGRRIAALIRKESIQILRDPSSIMIAGVLPLLLLFLFGYGVSLDLRDVDVCVVAEAPTPETATLADSFLHSPFFRAREVRDRRQCADDLVAGRVKGIIVIPADYAARAAQGGTAPIQLIVDGSEPNTSGLVQDYVQSLWQQWLATQGQASGAPAAAPVSLAPRYWFNATHDSRQFLLPGLVVVNLSLIGILLTSLVMAREWERGTMEALMSTPIGIVELLVGKLAPYFLLGQLAMAISVGASILLFGVPFRGSLLVLAGIGSVFLVAMLAIGLLISSLTRNQFFASQIAMIAGFLPAVILSGFLFEIDSMPAPVRLLSYLLPARYFVPCLETLFLAGNVKELLIPNTLAMAGEAVLLVGAAALATRRRLD